MRLFHLAKIDRLFCFSIVFAVTVFPVSLANAQSYPETEDQSSFTDFDINVFADGRLRYHTVSQGNLPETSEALTFRLKGGVEFEFTEIFSALIEVEASESLIDNFNDTLNGQIDRPVILDIDSFELNRLQIQSEIEGLRITVGRQDLALDNWRFLGNWQFRQNNQTFDAFRVETLLGRGRFNAAYFNKVHRHFGDDSPVGQFSGNSYVLNYSHPLPLGQISLFHYALDLETGDPSVPINTFSNATSGVRWHGRRHWEDYGLIWDLSLARQTNHADNPNDFAALYKDVGLGFQYKKLIVEAGFEILGSDDGVSVQTPLGTLHDFQGVTDRFFNTPQDGLRDINIGLRIDLGSFGDLERIEFKTRYHEFTSDKSRREYGREFNLGLSGKIKDFTLLFEYGNFDSQAPNEDVGLFTNDTNALILSAAYSFD